MSVILPLFLLETLAAAYFGDLGLHSQRTIVAIAMAESGGQVDAINRNTGQYSEESGSPYHTDYGLLQINSVHGFDSERLLSEPEYNFECGRKIYDWSGSFKPWVAYNLDTHAGYMSTAAELSSPRSHRQYLRLLWEASEAATEVETSLIPLVHVNGQDRYLIRRVR